MVIILMSLDGFNLKKIVIMAWIWIFKPSVIRTEDRENASVLIIDDLINDLQ